MYCLYKPMKVGGKCSLRSTNRKRSGAARTPPGCLGGTPCIQANGSALGAAFGAALGGRLGCPWMREAGEEKAKTKKKNWCYYYMLLPPKRTENNKTTDEIVRSQLTIQEKSRKERCCQWMETNKESHCRGVNVAASPCL